MGYKQVARDAFLCSLFIELGTVVKQMLNFIRVSELLILNGEVVKVLNLSRKILFSKVCSDTLQVNSIQLLTGYPARYHLLSGRVAGYQKSRLGSCITGYEPNIGCDSSSH